MKLIDFIKKYDKNVDNNMVEQAVKCKYLSFAEKCNLCERIIQSTYYTTMADGKTKLHINSASKYMLYNLSIIDKYTDIEINFNDVLAEYDMLAERNLFYQFKAYLPLTELQELDLLLEMAQQDVIANEYEPHAFISNQVERFGTLIGVSLSPILEKLSNNIGELDNEKLAAILSKLDKVDVKKVAKLLK